MSLDAIVLAVAIAAAPALAQDPDVRAPRADAALVLSGDVDYLRLARGIALYREEAVPRLLLTGAGVGGDSATEMRRIAMARGVPGEAILVETQSRSTYENLALAAPIIRAQGWRRLLLVTSEFHMERAARTARKLLPEVTWIEERVPDAGGPAQQQAARRQERLKLLWYALKGWI